MTPRVREILEWYNGEPLGVVTNMARMLNAGFLGGSGKLAFLSESMVSQQASFKTYSTNKNYHDPVQRYKLACELGANAYIAPLGTLQSQARDFAGEVPLIVEMNQLSVEGRYQELVSFSSVKDTGCVAIQLNLDIFEYKNDLSLVSQVISEAKSQGVPTLVRGVLVKSDVIAGLDMFADFAHTVCELGAHIISLPYPELEFSSEAKQKQYRQLQVKVNKDFDRIKHLAESAFNGKRLIVFQFQAHTSVNDQSHCWKEIARGGGFGTMLNSEFWYQLAAEEASAKAKELMSLFKF